MTTEHEAKNLWCPMVRLREQNAPAHNRRILGVGETEHDFCYCIGSRCAMWRWAHDDDGFCGLAGKP